MLQKLCSEVLLLFDGDIWACLAVPLLAGLVNNPCSAVPLCKHYVIRDNHSVQSHCSLQGFRDAMEFA